MAILFQCPCGKQLRVPDEQAGGFIKCPGCGEEVIVPAASPAAAITSAAPPHLTAPRDKVHFRCECGRQLTARREYAGEKTVCPACNRVRIIPAADEAGEVQVGRVRSARFPAAREVGGAPSPVPTSRRRVWPWVTAAVAFLLLVGGGVAALLLLRNPGASRDLTLVPRDALGFVSFRVADFWNGPQGQQIQTVLKNLQPDALTRMEQSFGGLTPGDIDRVTLVVLEGAPSQPGIILSLNRPVDQKRFLAAFLPRGEEKQLQGKTYHAGPTSAVWFVDPQTLVAGDRAGVEMILRQEHPGPPSGPVGEALHLAGENKQQLVAAFRLPGDLLAKGKANLRRPDSSPEARLMEPLLDLESIVVSGNFGNDTDLELRGQFPDEARAAKARNALQKLLALARERWNEMKRGANLPMAGPFAAQGKVLMEELDRALQALAPEQRGKESAARARAAAPPLAPEQRGKEVRLALHLKGQAGSTAILTGLLIPSVQKVREAAARAENRNNLKQLALRVENQNSLKRAENQNNLKQLARAMHSYHAAHKKFPAARIGGGLSWRVALLPFVGEEALYRQFHLNEPWDSPHNIRLLARMPRVYAHPGVKEEFAGPRTHYQVFTGPGTPFQGNEAPTLGTFKDGLSNTFLIVEAGTSVPWTKPDDVAYDPQRPVPRLGLNPEGFSAAMGDGSVRFIPRTVSEKILRALITPAGGEEIPASWD